VPVREIQAVTMMNMYLMFFLFRVTYDTRKIDSAVMAPMGEVKARESKWLNPKPLMTIVPNVPIAPDGTPVRRTIRAQLYVL
jgi:hypothetical protein